jgi:transcription antitermination factor NusG
MNACPKANEWYAVYTRPKFEKKISHEISLSMGDYESYLPLRTVLRRWSDRMKKIEEPLLPNYIFVKMPASEKYRVLSVNGTVRFVSSDGKPVPIKETDIQRIRQIESQGSNILFEGINCAGDKVRVIRGAFSGYEGELIRKMQGSRLLIKLPVINQAVSVEISLHDVERIA